MKSVSKKKNKNLVLKTNMLSLRNVVWVHCSWSEVLQNPTKCWKINLQLSSSDSITIWTKVKLHAPTYLDRFSIACSKESFCTSGCKQGFPFLKKWASHITYEWWFANKESCCESKWSGFIQEIWPLQSARTQNHIFPTFAKGCKNYKF